jgi:hypothetical protein
VTSRITVVVMTRDRWPDLQTSLPRHEAPVILVDNGSSDGTPRLVREHFPHVEVVELSRNVGSVARNVGVERARTPYVAFADDDSWWAPGALTRAVHVLDTHPRLAVLAGRMLVGPEERPDPICELMADSPLGRDDDLPGPSVLGFLACGAVVRRDAYLAGGGFDEVVFFMGEEERLALDLAALGWGLAYVQDVVAGARLGGAAGAGGPQPAADHADATALARGAPCPARVPASRSCGPAGGQTDARPGAGGAPPTPTVARARRGGPMSPGLPAPGRPPALTRRPGGSGGAWVSTRRVWRGWLVSTRRVWRSVCADSAGVRLRTRRLDGGPACGCADSASHGRRGDGGRPRCTTFVLVISSSSSGP